MRGLIVALVLLMAVVSLVVSQVLGRKRLRFIYATGTLPAPAYVALAARPGWSASGVDVAPGVRLNGLVRRPGSPDAPWVLFYPGNDPAQLATGQAFLERLRGDHDWGLAVFAYRGFDSSGGRPFLDDLRHDAVRTFDHLLESEHVAPSRLHVAAFSIGGNLAVHAVGEATRQAHRPASLTLLASVDDIVMVRPSLLARVAPGDDYQTRPMLDGVQAPVLVVQGTADEALGGPQQGRDLAATLGGRARYVELPGVGHNVLLATDAAVSEARAFIESVNPP